MSPSLVFPDLVLPQLPLVFVWLCVSVAFLCSRWLCSSPLRLAGNLEWDAAWKLQPHDFWTHCEGQQTHFCKVNYNQMFTVNNLPNVEVTSVRLPLHLPYYSILPLAIVFSRMLRITTAACWSGSSPTDPLCAFVCHSGNRRSGQLIYAVRLPGLR